MYLTAVMIPIFLKLRMLHHLLWIIELIVFLLVARLTKKHAMRARIEVDSCVVKKLAI